MSSREFSEWIAYARIEPYGEARADIRSGMIAATIANSVRDPKKKPAPFEPTDFIVRFEDIDEDEDEDEAPAWERVLAHVEMLNAAFGGRDIRGDP